MGPTTPAGTAISHQQAAGVITDQSLGSSTLAFIGGSGSNTQTTVTAQGNQTLLIGAGANALINNFSLAAGDKLDLTPLLSGAALGGDLSNLGSFLTVHAQAANAGGSVVTMLEINGPGGSASLALSGTGPVTMSDLLGKNALILPQH